MSPGKITKIPQSDIYLHALGGLAQLARALAWHARGHRFDSVILHKNIRHLRESS